MNPISGIAGGLAGMEGLGGSAAGNGAGSNQNTLSNLISAEGQEMKNIMQAASTAIGAMGDAAKSGATAQ